MLNRRDNTLWFFLRLRDSRGRGVRSRGRSAPITPRKKTRSECVIAPLIARFFARSKHAPQPCTRRLRVWHTHSRRTRAQAAVFSQDVSKRPHKRGAVPLRFVCIHLAYIAVTVR